MALVSTVASKRSNYSNQDYLRAVKARELHIKIGRPSLKDYIRIVTVNLLPNCPVTKADILVAEDIFGPEMGILKGKTKRRKPSMVRRVVEPIPPAIMRQYRHVTLGADIMHINGIPFFFTVSRHIKFGTIEPLVSRRQEVLINAIKAVAQIYHRGGFQVMQALMDGEFEPLRGNLADCGIALNSTARDEHVGEAEQYIRTI